MRYDLMRRLGIAAALVLGAFIGVIMSCWLIFVLI